jgi:thiol-disulfide isomerase/thioredoxin
MAVGHYDLNDLVQQRCAVSLQRRFNVGESMARQAPAYLAGRLRRVSASGWLRLAVIGCAGLAVALALLARVTAPAPGQTSALIGHAAPSFTATAAQGGQMLTQQVSFDGRSGRLTLLVFFDTLCVHCVAGVQTAGALAQASGMPPLDIIYLDAPGENADITGQYMARVRIDAPVLLDHDARIASHYGVAYYPSFILVDTHGIVRAVWTGTPAISELRAAITSAR